jgi:DnaA family protein
MVVTVAGEQLTLDLYRYRSALFENYFSGGNGEVVEALRRLVSKSEAQSVYLWGAPGTGKTHLLQALCCAFMDATGAAVVYLPVKDALLHGPEVCEGMDSRQLVCVDDVDSVAGNPHWEQTLFALYNRMRDRGHTLVVSGKSSPRESTLALADLRSRLGWGLVYQLRALDDSDKRGLMIERARARGLELADDVAEYALRRLPRDIAGLCAFIDRVDKASLAAQRHVTIPFVRSLLETQ